MNYSTFDRFQGAWLGGILVSYFKAYLWEMPPENYILNNKPPSWVMDRDKIAQVVLSNLSKAKFISEIKAFLPQYTQCKVISLLLPLFLADLPYKNIYKEIISQNKFELINTSETQEDILIWNYLIILALTDRLKLEESNLGRAIGNILGGVKLETTSLTKKLELVSQAEKNSSTLQQLTEQLRQQENLGITTQCQTSMAIALSLYCFASTPRNFMLSVKRASQINSPLSEDVAILTATISGAYNGLGGITKNWQFLVSRDRHWRQIQDRIEQLFTTWLGIHNPMNNDGFVCDVALEAIAIPKIIQPRKNLQIISQKSDLG